MAITTQDRITETETMIENLSTAINATILGGHSSYEVDTGQSNQGVKRLSLSVMQTMRKNLYQELAALNALLGNSRATVTVIPGF